MAYDGLPEAFAGSDSDVLQESEKRMKEILDAKYKPADLAKVVETCQDLTKDERQDLLALLEEFKDQFDGTLGTWMGDPYEIELKEEDRFPDSTFVEDSEAHLELRRLTIFLVATFSFGFSFFV